MEQKTKFILVGLIGVSVIFVFLYIQSLNSKQLIIRERDELKKENISLSNKIDKIGNDLRVKENKIASLSSDLDKVNQDLADFQRKYELANKAKEELAEKLKSKQAEPQTLPQTTDAYWAGIFKAKTDLELQLGTIRNDLNGIKITNEQLQREKSTLELNINNLMRENTDLKRQLEYNQKLMDSISQELVREKNDKIRIHDAFKTIKNENTTLIRQLESLNNRKINLERKLQEVQGEKGAIERRFNEMETMLTDKISKINDLKEELDAIRSGTGKREKPQQKKESVELPPIVVRPQSGSPGQQNLPAMEGQILAINKDNNFVIVDLGEDAGVKVGDSFQVYSEGKSIAAIEAIQVRKNISACDIKKESTPIKIGDTIK